MSRRDGPKLTELLAVRLTETTAEMIRRVADDRQWSDSQVVRWLLETRLPEVTPAPQR